MTRPPGLAERFPAEYMEYLAGHPRDHVVGRSTLYGSPLDPGERLGRQGDENFPSSVLIGRRDPMHIILSHDGSAASGADAWRYALVTGSESTTFAAFSTFGELLAHLRTERPVAETQGRSGSPRPARTKRRRHG